MIRGLVLLAATALIAAAPPTELSPDGLPPLIFGMTPAEAGKALRQTLAIDYADESKACGQVRDPRYRTTTLMFVDGRLARIDVRRPGLDFRGVGVGDSEKAVRAALPKVATEPHKYTNGFYLTARLSPGTSVVFETEQGRVTRFRVGNEPAVSWVEGCY